MSDSVFTPAELADKRQYIASRAARDHWGAVELDHVDHEAKWLATVDQLREELANGHTVWTIRARQLDHLVAENTRLRERLALATTPCTHGSASGVDQTAFTDLSKIWRCDACGFLFRNEVRDGITTRVPVGDTSVPSETRHWA